MEIETRRAVRVVCVDNDARVLLMRWRDPHAGDVLWETPGGGVEADETNLDAARREWREETGLEETVVSEHNVVVHRDEMWLGRRLVYDEPTFLARWPGRGPVSLSRAGLMDDETAKLIETRWVGRTELAGLADRLTPDVADILSRLDVPGWT